MVIPIHNYTPREKTVVDILYENRNLNINSFLNVGFHNWEDPRRHWWIKICEQNKIDWKILEIYEPNVIDTINKGCPKEKIKNGNILDCNFNVDCLLFWHGCEHVNKEIFLNYLPKIEFCVNKLIIFGMPLGNEPQDEAYGNPYEKHISSWFEKDWTDINYNVIPIYDKQKYPHMTTYKIISK